MVRVHCTGDQCQNNQLSDIHDACTDSVTCDERQTDWRTLRDSFFLLGYAGERCQDHKPCDIHDVCFNGGSCVDLKVPYESIDTKVNRAIFT